MEKIKEMEYNVFMSYTSGDNAIAMRIYNDLERSGLNVWRYEKDGEIGRDFIDEIDEMISKSESFILIDSSHARESNYVKDECKVGQELFINKSGNIQKFLVCLVEEKRITFTKDELFANHNRLRFINFSGYTYWDNNEIYLKGIQLLCKELGKDYTSSPLSIPSYRDFEKELSAVEISALSDKGENISEKEAILKDFESFLYRYRQKDPNSKKRIQFIIEASESLGLKLTTPYLSLGIIQSETNEFEDALATFKQVTKDFPDDPRGFASSGAMLFKLERYQEAYENYDKAIKIARIHKDNRYIQDHHSELIYNKIQVMVRLEKFNEAINEINNLSPGQKALPEIKIALIFIHLFQNNLSKAKELYDNLQLFYSPETVIHNSSDLNFIFGDLEFQLGKIFAGSDNYNDAICHYENSIKYNSKSIRYFAELALLYHALPDIKKQNKTIEEGLKLNPYNNTEIYFYGLLYYLQGNYSEARRLYDLSQMEKHGWEYYDKLIL